MTDLEDKRRENARFSPCRLSWQWIGHASYRKRVFQNTHTFGITGNPSLIRARRNTGVDRCPTTLPRKNLYRKTGPVYGITLTPDPHPKTQHKGTTSRHILLVTPSGLECAAHKLLLTLFPRSAARAKSRPVRQRSKMLASWLVQSSSSKSKHTQESNI